MPLVASMTLSELGLGSRSLLLIKLAVLVDVKLLQKFFLKLGLGGSLLLLIKLAIFVQVELSHESGFASLGLLFTIGSACSRATGLGLTSALTARSLRTLGALTEEGGSLRAVATATEVVRTAGLHPLTEAALRPLGALTEEGGSLRAVAAATEVVRTTGLHPLAEAALRPLGTLTEKGGSLRTVATATEVVRTAGLHPLTEAALRPLGTLTEEGGSLRAVATATEVVRTAGLHPLSKMTRAMTLRALSLSKSSFDGSLLLVVDLTILIHVKFGHKLSLASLCYSPASIGISLAGGSHSFLGGGSSFRRGSNSLTGSKNLRKLHSLLSRSRGWRRHLRRLLRSDLLSH